MALHLSRPDYCKQRIVDLMHPLKQGATNKPYMATEECSMVNLPTMARSLVQKYGKVNRTAH